MGLESRFGLPLAAAAALDSISGQDALHRDEARLGNKKLNCGDFVGWARAPVLDLVRVHERKCFVVEADLPR